MKLIKKHCPLFKGDKRNGVLRNGAEGVFLVYGSLHPLRFATLHFATLVPLKEGQCFLVTSSSLLLLLNHFSLLHDIGSLFSYSLFH